MSKRYTKLAKPKLKRVRFIVFLTDKQGYFSGKINFQATVECERLQVGVRVWTRPRKDGLEGLSISFVLIISASGFLLVSCAGSNLQRLATHALCFHCGEVGHVHVTPLQLCRNFRQDSIGHLNERKLLGMTMPHERLEDYVRLWFQRHLNKHNL